jgi:hypothetical protein
LVWIYDRISVREIFNIAYVHRRCPIMNLCYVYSG